MASPRWDTPWTLSSSHEICGSPRWIDADDAESPRSAIHGTYVAVP